MVWHVSTALECGHRSGGWGGHLIDAVSLQDATDEHGLGPMGMDGKARSTRGRFPISYSLFTAPKPFRRFDLLFAHPPWTSQLFSAEPEHRQLVKYHFNFHFTSRSTPALEVDAEAIPYMDLIVIGWVVMTRDIENMSQGPKLG